MLIKAVQGMLNVAVDAKAKAIKNVTTVEVKGEKQVQNAKIKAWKAYGAAKAKVDVTDEGVANVVEKISSMSDSLKTKAAKLDKIIASVRK